MVLSITELIKQIEQGDKTYLVQNGVKRSDTVYFVSCNDGDFYFKFDRSDQEMKIFRKIAQIESEFFPDYCLTIETCSPQECRENDRNVRDHFRSYGLLTPEEVQTNSDIFCVFRSIEGSVSSGELMKKYSSEKNQEELFEILSQHFSSLFSIHEMARRYNDPLLIPSDPHFSNRLTINGSSVWFDFDFPYNPNSSLIDRITFTLRSAIILCSHYFEFDYERYVDAIFKAYPDSDTLKKVCQNVFSSKLFESKSIYDKRRAELGLIDNDIFTSNNYIKIFTLLRNKLDQYS